MPSPYVESSGFTNRWMNVTKALEPVHLSLEVNKKGQRSLEMGKNIFWHQHFLQVLHSTLEHLSCPTISPFQELTGPSTFFYKNKQMNHCIAATVKEIFPFAPLFFPKRFREFRTKASFRKPRPSKFLP